MALPSSYSASESAQIITGAKLIHSDDNTKSLRSDYVKTLNEKVRGIVTVDKIDFSLFDFNGKDKSVKVIKHTQPWDLYRMLYHRNPLIANAVDNTVDFLLQADFELEGAEADKTAILEFFKTHNFHITLSNIAKQMLIFGNAYLELGGINDDGTGTITGIKLLPVEQMFVEVSVGANDGEIASYVQIINSQVRNRWSPNRIIHFKWNEVETSFYGISDLLRVLMDLTRLENWKEDLGIILHRYANIIIQWQVGDMERPGTKSQVDDFTSSVEQRTTGEDFVTSGNINAKVIAPDLRMIQPDNLITFQENQIIAGLRVPEIFIRGGRTSNKATADVEAQMFDRKIRALGLSIMVHCVNQLFPKITNGEVSMQWNELTTEGKEIQSKTLMQLRQAGLPLKTALDIVGWGSWKDNVEEDAQSDIPMPQFNPANKQGNGAQVKSAKEYLEEQGYTIESGNAGDEDEIDQYGDYLRWRASQNSPGS